MRQVLKSRFVLLLICCFGLQYTAQAQDNTMTLKQALDKNLVILKSAVALTSKSGTAGIELSLVNITCANIAIEADPALVFRPKASGAPEVVLAGKERFELAPEKQQKVVVSSYRMSDDGRGAEPGEKYGYYKQDASLRKVLAYVQDKHINAKLAQKAVLTVADGAPLASVYDAKQPKASKQLQKFLVSDINASSSDGATSKFAAYKPPPPVDTKMVINLEMNFRTTRNLNIRILNADGFVYPDMSQHEYVNGTNGSRNVDVEVDTAHMPHGTYYVSVRDDDNKVWSQKTITI